MDSFKDHLKVLYKRALYDCFDYEASDELLSIRPTPKNFEGHLTFTVFPLAKVLKRPLSELGEVVGKALLRAPEVARYELVAGFLNIQLEDSAWIKAAATLRDQIRAHEPQRILIEYSSPNTNKPLHLGHMRNNFLGNALARIWEALGHTSYQVSLVNDRGIHISKSMTAYLSEGKEQKPKDPTEGDQFVGNYYLRFEQIFRKEVDDLRKQGRSTEEATKESEIMQRARHLLRAWEDNDPEVRRIWKMLNEWVYKGFASTYERMGIHFDKTFYESETYLLGKKVVEEGLEKGLFYRNKDGAIAINLEEEGLGEKILLREDGTSVYVTQELGTADLKRRTYDFDRSLYVVGDEQNYHFQVLFALLRRLERPYAHQLEHISYGMVDLPSGKMKSREGNVVDANDLLDTLEEMAEAKTQQLGKVEHLGVDERARLCRSLALGAIKYFLLKVHPKKRILFDPEASFDLHASTAAFVQYTHARIAALLRRAVKEQLTPSPLPLPQTLRQEEQALLAHLLDYEEEVEAAARAYDPSIVVQYVYELGRRYNRWYETHPIFSQRSVASWRLWLSERTKWRIQHALSLLGIEAPEQM